MTFFNNLHLPTKICCVSLVVLTVFSCTTDEELLPPPNELKLEEVMEVQLKDQLNLNNDGFIQSIAYYNNTVIQVETTDHRTFYYKKDESGEFYNLTSDIGAREFIDTVSVEFEEEGLIACSRREVIGGTNYRFSIQCGLFACYLHTDTLDDEGKIIAEANPAYLGNSLPHNIIFYCVALHAVEL